MRKGLRPVWALCTAVAVAAAACLFLSASARGDGLVLKESLTGRLTLPADEMREGCWIAYAFPQFEGTSETDEAINRFYQQQADQTSLLAQQVYDEGAEGAEIGWEMTLNTERYLSVTRHTRLFTGHGEYELLGADTFARDGLYAGQALTLSQVLGLEQEAGETGETPAETLAYDLVWQIVERSMQNADGDYLEGVTRERLCQILHPERDFYLDEDGNIVFFIQAGEIAGEIAGILRFPFAPAELLSAGKTER